MAISRLMSMIAVISMYTKKNTKTSPDFLGQRAISGSFKYTVLLSLHLLSLPIHEYKKKQNLALNNDDLMSPTGPDYTDAIFNKTAHLIFGLRM